MLSLNIHAKSLQKATCDSLIRKGVQKMSEKRYEQSLELLTEAKNVARQEHDYACLFLSFNNIGANYYNLLDYGEALENYLQAYNIALKHLDDSKEMIVLNNIAILYSKDSQHEKAEEYFLRAYKIAEKSNNSRNIARYATNLGLVSNKLRKLSSAITYFEKANSILNDHDELKAESQVGLAENYLLREKPNEAIEIITHAYPDIKKFDDKELEVEALYLLARSYQKRNDLEKAIHYAGKAVTHSETLNEKAEGYELLASLYEKQKKQDRVIDMKDSLLCVNEQIFALKNGRLFETNKVKFELQQFQHELKEKDDTLKAERRTYFIVIGCILLAVLLIVYAWRNSKIQNEQRKTLIQRNRKLLAVELAKEKSDHLLLEKKMRQQKTAAQLEKKQLRLKIEKRNRKLAVKALEQSNRNKILKKIIHTLSTHTSLKENKDIKSYIKELKQYLKSDKEWADFFKHFEEVNGSFVKTLKQKHPELNANDIRFICYLYMNLSTKEIASLFNITPAACRKRKERIARKMDLETSGAITGYIFSI